MKKQTLLSLIFFLSQFLHSQDKINGSVTYVASLDISILGNYATKAPKKFHYKINQTLNNNKNIYYLLTFNNNQSMFVKDNRMKNDNKKNKINLTEIKAGKGIFFLDKVNNENLHQKNSFGEDFLISLPEIKWKITSEKKMIGKYLCYKATTEKSIENRRGIKEIKVEAWYTPEIPFNYGPKNYNGLPGLIIELKEGSLLFSAKVIKINAKEFIKIKKPTNGKKIKLKDFNLMVKKIFSNQKRF